MKFFKKIILFLLKTEARLVIKKHKPLVIGITGSVGKTSTKDAIAALLGDYFDIRKSPKSYNSEIGIPLTVLNVPNAWHSSFGWVQNVFWGAWRVVSRSPYPEMLVLEMGVDRPGDFDWLLSWISPDIAVVTAIGEVPVHVEFFSGPDALAEEKAKLVAAIRKDGHAILNADDPKVLAMKKYTEGKIITYGTSKDAMVRASGYRLMIKNKKPCGISFKIEYEGKSTAIKAESVLGRHAMTAMLAASAVALVRGLSLMEIAEGLLWYRQPPGRLNLIEGRQKTTLIDDSYNSSPLALSVALSVLSEIPGGRKIAVIGDMLELGKFTVDEHKKAGALAAGAADVVIAVGMRAKFMESSNAKYYKWFQTSSEAADFLQGFITEGDIILVKGSQGARMEKIVKALMLQPERAGELLVRQEQYWLEHK